MLQQKQHIRFTKNSKPQSSIANYWYALVLKNNTVAMRNDESKKSQLEIYLHR